MTTMRKNNFDIVRLLLALLVVLVHCYDLSYQPHLIFLKWAFNSRMAVEGFFAISGFLIFASYERAKTLREYCANRAWRILPGYWLSTIVCLLIAFCHGSFHVGKFLFANFTFLTFLQPNIAGVFTHNPGNDAMNGALWTIKVEVMFYVAVPMIVWLCRRWQRDAVMLTLLVLSLLYHWRTNGHESLQVQLPGQLSFFLVGALISYHLEFFKRYGWWMVAAAAIMLKLQWMTGYFAFRPFAIGVLVLGACLLLPHIEGPTRWGDFSYGTYILHYPLLQTLIELGIFRAYGWGAVALSLLLIGCAAFLSWTFLEKPSLQHAKSQRLRRSAEGATANFPAAVP